MDEKVKHLKISLGILEELINSYDEDDRDSLVRVNDIIKKVESDFSIKATFEDISENCKRLNSVSELTLEPMLIPTMYGIDTNGVYVKNRLSYIEFVASEFRKEIHKSQ